MGFKRKIVWKFRTIKRAKTIFSTFQTISLEHKHPKRINWIWPSWTIRIKLNETRRKREIRSKPLELCKTRIKKSSLDMLNFYVISAGYDMVNDSDRSTTCRSTFVAPRLQRKIQKMKVLLKTRVSPYNCLNISDRKLKPSTFGIREQNKGTTKPQRQQLKTDLVTRNK